MTAKALVIRRAKKFHGRCKVHLPLPGKTTAGKRFHHLGASGTFYLYASKRDKSSS